jgi:hypothetical protein
MSTTGDYLRDLADQIDGGIAVCLDVRIDLGSESPKARHLHLSYHSLADATNSAGLATEESAANFRAALSRAQEAGEIPSPPPGSGYVPNAPRPYTVKLTDAVADHYRKLGEGNLTRGIEKASGLNGVSR